jgi:signal transduction histidine kinase
MKIRRSLKLYFFLSVVLLGSSMVIAYSFLSVNYYIDGLDRALNSVMRELSLTTDIEDGESKTIAGFNVAKRWQDTPNIIQQRFLSAPTDTGVLQKITDQKSALFIPDNIYFVVLYYNPNGEKRFISRTFLKSDRPTNTGTSQPKKRLYWSLIIAIIAIAIFVFFLVMIMQKIAKPIESLKGWAKSLDKGNVLNSPPDFTYTELNDLATLVQSSLISAHQSLEREQHFLSYASHELRTPIAVIRSNVDLLLRLNEKHPGNEKQELTIQRIERAGLTMSNLTDTLLWLSRNDEQVVAETSVYLDEVIKRLCDELNYLLEAKKVDVKTETEHCNVKIQATACHIVLSNLIRNAYQHTHHGHIHIKQTGSLVSILNTNQQDDNTVKGDSSGEQVAFGNGYGLGLQLSEKIIKRHGWFYEVSDDQTAYQVSVDFRKRM